MHELLAAWAQFEPCDGANVLPGDECLLQPKVDRHVVIHRSWDQLIGQGDFGKWDQRLHLSLLPQPFFGDLSQARVFVLTLNPGLHPIDYYAEFTVPEYRQASIDTLRQRAGREFPFAWFDPRFSWHSGFAYWHGRFAGLIDSFAQDRNMRRGDALSFFSNSVAVLELLPYHSVSFGLPTAIVNELRSVRLARSFVSEILVPRAKAGEVLLIVARQATVWGLGEADHTIVYKGSETRGAYLTPESRGGKAILEHLERTAMEASITKATAG